MVMKELLCIECRKRCSYEIKKRVAKTIIKNIEIEYEELYGICNQCKSEIFVPGLDDINNHKIEKEFRNRKGLITILDINKILEKYDIEKRPLSKLLGFGELTITRYIDGQLPSLKYSEVMLSVLHDEQVMKKYVEENKELVSSVAISKVLKKIERYESLKKIDNSAEKIALYIVNSGKNITNLLLQKLLYYVKSISGLFEGGTIIKEPCEAWRFGPVFPAIYEKYKEFGKQEIEIDLPKNFTDSLLSAQERKITDYVLDTFGIYNAWFLKDLTHLEEPWVVAREGFDESDASRNQMDEAVITNYFNLMNNKFNLKTPDGIEAYVNEMKKQMKVEPVASNI